MPVRQPRLPLHALRGPIKMRDLSIAPVRYLDYEQVAGREQAAATVRDASAVWRPRGFGSAHYAQHAVGDGSTLASVQTADLQVVGAVRLRLIERDALPVGSRCR